MLALLCTRPLVLAVVPCAALVCHEDHSLLRCHGTWWHLNLAIILLVQFLVDRQFLCNTEILLQCEKGSEMVFLPLTAQGANLL